MIRVSDLVHYLLCPRIVFYERKGMEYRPRTDPVRAAKKALALGLSGGEGRLVLRSRREGGKTVEERAERSPPDSSRKAPPLQTPEGWARAVARVRRELGAEAEAALREWSPEALATLAPSREVQPILESEALGLRGEVDKLVARDGQELPALVRATEPPSTGAWRSDRVALAAYAMLLERTRGVSVNRGLVEYVGALPPVSREVRITGYDRKMVRALLERVRSMGPRLPRRPWKAPCDSCNFYSLCFPRGRRIL